MKKLPIGIQNFRKIAEGGYLYADKTEYIYKLINNSSYYFLSRPRRFGKSLLLDTIAEVFSGNKELFEGLWIHDSDYPFKKHPVIRLDMSKISSGTPEILAQSLLGYLRNCYTEEGFEPGSSIESDAFYQLIALLYKKYNERVVVLIDEYDKPILDHITDLEKAEANRRVIKGFYGVLKSMDPYLRFTLLTGVSKFAKTSVFSELNNLYDITLDDEYANICGFTTDDFDKHFAEHMKYLSSAKNLMRYADLRGEILRWYDGYSWDGETRVLNPFSLLSFFSKKRFVGFWYNSGTPGFLVNLIKEKPHAFANMRKTEITEGLLNYGELDRISLIPLMFQSGYLTVTGINYDTGGEPAYVLDMPNFEVREAFNLHVLSDLTLHDNTDTRTLCLDLRRSLRECDMEKALAVLRRLFSSIPYEIHVDEDDYYHSIFYALMNFTGLDTTAEVSVADGRVDVIMEYTDKVYVMEFKHEKCGKDVCEDTKRKLIAKMLDEGMEQIEKRDYTGKYRGSSRAVHKVVFAFAGRNDIEMRHEAIE